MTIEYNKIKVYNNELLSKTNTEKSENNTNLLNNSNKKLVGCYENTKKVMTRISLISLSTYQKSTIRITILSTTNQILLQTYQITELTLKNQTSVINYQKIKLLTTYY